MRNIKIVLILMTVVLTFSACPVVQEAKFSISNTSTSDIYVTFLEHAQDLQSESDKIYRIGSNSKRKETFTWYYSGVFKSEAYIYTSDDLETQIKNYTEVPIRLNNGDDIQYIYTDKRTFE